MDRETPRTTAEAMALDALAWIARDEDLLGRFAAATGADAEAVIAGATSREPAFLAGILEFLCSEDRWIVAFCDAHGLPYDRPMRALAELPGGRRDEWP